MCASLFDNVYSHRPGAPYGDQRIGINHMKSSKNSKEELSGGLRQTVLYSILIILWTNNSLLLNICYLPGKIYNMMYDGSISPAQPEIFVHFLR